VRDRGGRAGARGLTDRRRRRIRAGVHAAAPDRADATAPDRAAATVPRRAVRREGHQDGRGGHQTVVKGPAASSIVTRCRPAGTCPYKQRVRLIPGPQGATRTVRIKRLERRYRANTTVRVYIVKFGFIGKYTSFIVRRGKQPRRYDRCLRGRELKQIRCPAG